MRKLVVALVLATSFVAFAQAGEPPAAPAPEKSRHQQKKADKAEKKAEKAQSKADKKAAKADAAAK
jgi:hypothetical protein